MPMANAPPCLKPRTLGNLLDADMPVRGWLLQPWLREQESAMVWAAAGVGKTMLTLSIALAIAGGGKLLGWEAATPRRVLLVDGEMPEDDLRDRLHLLKGTVEGLDLEAARRNLTILARHGQNPDAPFPDFGDPGQHGEIARLIREHDPALVILDNLSTLATLDDENSASATQPVTRLLTRLKQERVAVIAVHHSGKAGAGFRGSSMLATTFEVIMGLTRDREKAALDPTGHTAFRMVWDKFRGRRDISVTDRDVSLADTPEGSRRWTSATPDEQVLGALAALIRTCTYPSQATLAGALPRHLWPGDTPPSSGWVSQRMAAMKAAGIMSGKEVRECFEAARSGGEGTAAAFNEV